MSWGLNGEKEKEKSVEGVDYHFIKKKIDEEVLEDLTPEASLLSHVSKLKGNVIKVTSFNEEELLDLVAGFQGKAYYSFGQRELQVYIQA